MLINIKSTGIKSTLKSCPPPPGCVDETNTTSSTSHALLPYGRPSKPKSLLTHQHIEKNIELAKNKITQKYNQSYKFYKLINRKVPQGTYKKLYIATKKKYELGDEFKYTYTACMVARINCDKHTTICTTSDLFPVFQISCNKTSTRAAVYFPVEIHWKEV